MFIRRPKTASKSDNEHNYTYRLVENLREGKKARQEILLNLGAYFTIAREHWPALVQRVQSLITGQTDLGMEHERVRSFEGQRPPVSRGAWSNVRHRQSPRR